MKLKRLLSVLDVCECTADPELDVRDISFDSRTTQPGDLFTIHLHLPRDAYKRMKDMERRKLYTKDEIFLLGLRA